MTAAARAEGLAAAAQPFVPWLGRVSASGLLAFVRVELGNENILDDFQPHGAAGGFSKAVAPRTILHVISGNTPHAGLQSLLRGLLLGSHNLCKLPTGGVPEVSTFCAGLPPELAAGVELSETLPEEWLARAEAVIVFGTDKTVETFRRRVRADQVFVGHGHRVSLGIVWDDPGFASVPGAARDASLFDQRGCQSPHGFYVGGGNARAYAERLGAAMAEFNRAHPRATLSAAEAANIHALREDYGFRAALDPERVGLWASTGSTDWTVVFDAADPAFTASTLDRVVFVKPLPPTLPELLAALAPVRAHLGAIGLYPATLGLARRLDALGLGVSRFCAVGHMQEPPMWWHQDGLPNLGALVRWVDFGPGEGE